MFSKAHVGVVASAASVPLAALAISACGSSGSTKATTPVPPKTTSGGSATVGLESDDTLGKVLVDSRGRTLYLFQKDSSGRSACTGACAAAWPPLRANGPLRPGPGLTASKLATAPRSDGKPQVAYNGHPLYLYSGDTKVGDANGQGVNAFGAPWYAVSAAGDLVSAPASSSGGGIY
jgi:predicted lipoprotein with Yx(FWY)xxD motif